MSSPFWKYFHDSLRWGLIDRPGPLAALAKGLAQRLDMARDDALFLRAQWFPQLCEPELVTDYGTSRGLVRHICESPEQYRTRVVNAYAWHMLGGKTEGLPQILRFYGFDIQEIDNIARYQPSRWAEFQVGLFSPADQGEQNGILESLATLVWLVNEYKPARSVLARLYTDIYNVTPLVWSEGSYSNYFYSHFSGVPASSLGPEYGNGDLILSFGLRHALEAHRPDYDTVPVFAGLARQGFIAPYIDAPIWSQFAYGDSFPMKHGFSVGQLHSLDFSDRAVSSYQWNGKWDARHWAEFAAWDRLLPKWRMQSRSLSRSQLVYGDPFLTEDAGRYSSLNACYSAPAAPHVGRPMRWSQCRYSDSTERRLVLIHERKAARCATATAGKALDKVAGVCGGSGVAATATAPRFESAWTGAWDARPWRAYRAFLCIKSIILEEA